MSEMTGDEWRELRVSKGWTQSELAAIAGVSSPVRVSEVERGLTSPEVERRLSEVLRPAVDGAVES